MDDSIAGLRAFVAFVDAGDFTTAGHRLGVSRSAVSKAVSRLEQRLGRRLLERSTRSLRLTDEGERLLPHARSVLDGLAQAADALQGESGPVRGTVRLALPPLFGRLRVLPLLHALGRQHPALRLEVEFSARVSELVADGVDLAIRIGEIADRAELIARRLGAQPTGLYAAPAYLQAHGMPRTGAALAGHALLFTADACLPPELPPPRLCLHDTAAQLEAALAGWGIARLPDWLAQPHCQAHRLQALLPGLAQPSLPIHLVWPRGRYLPRRVRLVIDALLQALAAGAG